MTAEPLTTTLVFERLRQLVEAEAERQGRAIEYHGWIGTRAELYSRAHLEPELFADAIIEISRDKKYLLLEVHRGRALLARVVEIMDVQAQAIAADDDATAEACWNEFFDLLEEVRETLVEPDDYSEKLTDSS